MDLKQQIQKDVAEAMRQGEAGRRDTLRMLLAAVKQIEVDEAQPLDDAGVQAVVAKQAKQRRESIADAEKAGRSEMAAQERAELAIIENYLPRMLMRDEIQTAAALVIEDIGATDVKQMGQVMGKLMPQLKGQADGRVVTEVVRELLQNKS